MKKVLVQHYRIATFWKVRRNAVSVCTSPEQRSVALRWSGCRFFLL